MNTTSQYTPFSASLIHPEGWLYRQLRLQAEGLAGNLDKVWPDVRDSKWIGGDREGWERVPYWLDGFVPLSWLLDDEDLKTRAKKYIDAILAGQQADGWLCPCTMEERGRYDMWALYLILKVLTLYADCSGDSRVEEVVYKALWNLRDHIRGCIVFNWASARWFECLIPIFWLYERRPEKWLRELACRLREQGLDWERMRKADYWHEPRREWSYSTHVVNLGMVIKAGALSAAIDGRRDSTESRAFLEAIRKYHSTCWGLFTGDECLSGASPVQGTELCAVVEAMYSCEVLLSLTGEAEWGDLLEKLAFNALPATCSADLWTHQYDQSSNQPNCAVFPGDPIFGTNGKDASLFGLEPNYGCCTANMGQGWPKLALYSVLRGEREIFSAVPVPVSVTAELDGVKVSLRQETDYPFRGNIKYIVTADAPVELTLSIRIPGTADRAKLDGKAVTPGSVAKLTRRWEGRTTVEMTLGFEIHTEHRPENLFCLRRGALYYSVPVKARRVMHEYTRDGVERKFPYCDWELYADSPWEYGFGAGETEYDERFPVPELPFDTKEPPCGITATLVPIGWGLHPLYPPAAARVPEDTTPTGTPERVRLVPYGCTDLRMTELPSVR